MDVDGMELLHEPTCSVFDTRTACCHAVLLDFLGVEMGMKLDE
jgi:hypothetical protein